MNRQVEANRRYRERLRMGLATPKPPAPPRSPAADPLVAALVARAPRLDGAACVGRWAMFDPAGADEDRDAVAARWRNAVVLCGQCPARTACEAWVSGLPRRE